MGEQSKIAWTDSTVNFWSGCTKVYLPNLKADQSGCQNCYAEELSGRFPTFGKWGKGAPRQLHESAFNLAAKLNRKPWVCENGHSNATVNCGTVMTNGCQTCGALNHRRRIFSLSLGDWLDPEIPVAWLARMLDTIRQCPDVDWLLCTKRPELWHERIKAAQMWLIDRSRGFSDRAATAAWLSFWRCGEKIPSNIVLLASVENQQAADLRIPQLLRIPAWRRGISAEPLLGQINLKSHPWIKPQDIGKNGLDWVIIGGESGNEARPCNVEWIRSLKDQCAAANVPCFVKQLGAKPVGRWTKSPKESGLGQGWPAGLKITDKKGGDWNEWPEDLRVRQFFKH